MTNDSSAVFLQARLGSQRLPHKILLDLGGTTVLEQCMIRLSKVHCDYFVVLTDKYSYPVLSHICRRHPGWECFEGPAQDVLARFVFAARHFAVNTIVRATADNPLVSHDLANMILARQRREGWDYAAQTGMPYGTGVEVIQSAALEQALADSMDPYDHEHVCPYLYNHGERFRIHREEAPEAYRQADLRLTLDTEEDYRFLKSLYSLYGLGKNPGLSEIIKSMYSVAV